MNKIKVLYDGTTIHEKAGGLGYVAKRILLEISKDPLFEITVFTRKGVSKIDGVESTNVQIIENNIKYPFFGMKRFFIEHFVIKNLIKKYSPDIVHFTSGFGLPTGIKPVFKIVVTVHDLIPLSPYREFINRVDYFFYKQSLKNTILHADKILAISKFTADDMHTYFPSQKDIEVIPDGVDMISNTELLSWESVASKFGITKDYLFYIGGYSPRKNVITLLKAFLEAKRQNNFNFQLVIAGPDSHDADTIKSIQNIKKFIVENNLSNEIKMLFSIPDEVKQLLFLHAKIFIYISLYEGFGLPVLEALSAGIPVLTSKKSAMAELCEDYATYTDPLNVNEIVEALFAIINNYNFNKQKAEESIKMIISKYSWSTIGKKYVQVYKDLCKQ